MHEEAATIPELEGGAIDLDVSDDGDWVAIRTSGSRVLAGSVAGFFPLPDGLRVPKVRRIDDDRLLVVGARARRGDANGRILDRAGNELHRFHAGDAIADALVVDDRIVVTYFDEADWGGPPPSCEGVAIFDMEGTLEAGYRSGVRDPVELYDCYCACAGASGEVWFYAYTDFPLVRLDLRTLEQEVIRVPPRLAGCSALSTDGTSFWFHGAYDDPTGVFRWQRGAEDAALVGSHSGRLRGTRRGAFLSVGTSGYTIVTP